MRVSAWRISKVRYHPYDGAGARIAGGRWNSPGHDVIYASDSFAGSILEVLAHALRPRTLPGPHHAITMSFPQRLVEVLDEELLDGWEVGGSAEARRYGDAWLRARRSAVLSVPSLPARPFGRTVMINPSHPDASHIEVTDPVSVPWDDRLF